jgi:hypothetical protein
VVVDQAGRKIPPCTGVLEVADQFALFGIDANDGKAAALEAPTKIREVEELIITIGTVVGGKFLAIDAQGIAHLMEKASDGVGTDDHTEVAQSQGDLVGSSPGPLQARDRIAGGIVFEEKLD